MHFPGRVLGGAGAGRADALPPAAGREHPAHRGIGISLGVMDQVYHGDGGLHQMHPLYNKP
nr:MAG TPA: hypothetical protein [Bacteriophage sp.]